VDGRLRQGPQRHGGAASLNQGYTRHFNVDYVHPDGRIVTVEINATTFTTNKGSIILSLCRDVTEHRQQEARLRHQQKLESIGTLAGGIAHEITNPINIILNYAQLLYEAAPTTARPPWTPRPSPTKVAASRAS
jgi:nitrogen-specific signal transduction histidine kinase